MSWKPDQGDEFVKIFSCDFPDCIMKNQIWFDEETQRWLAPDPLGRLVYLEKGSPTLMPPGWKSDGDHHFCWQYKIVFEPATIVEGYTTESPADHPAKKDQ